MLNNIGSIIEGAGLCLNPFFFRANAEPNVEDEECVKA
jgi:hypothetical protein